MLVSKLFGIQAVRFAAVGVSNTAIDFIVFMLLQHLTGVAAAQIIGYSAGTANSYYWNRKWTFARGTGWNGGELLRFIIVNVSVALITSVVISFIPSTIPVWIAKLCVTVLGLGINFGFSKLWVFR
ncbi:GtrA family protein [Paenibacillus campi]|uniref:GtrA family protein n=1 Tax=Paenibacillus campi TaxID=3106031 RepID=UPI002AFF281C|nr:MULTISPECIES: GtrA family protein [unclassified Paenibacillus]